MSEKITDLRWHTCTKEAPWTPELGKRGIHPSAVHGEQYDDYLGGSLVHWHCPVCGVRWDEELPQ